MRELKLREKSARGAVDLSIKRQMYKLLAFVFTLMLIIIGALVLMLMSVSRQYSNALQNANTAADFNTDFKNNIDLEMYNFVILPQEDRLVENLPMRELDAAVRVLHRLEETTTLTDNRWRIDSMLNMCENLREYMTEIAMTESYDERMEQLERNIRGETGLTILIEKYMHDYIDGEVRELAHVQSLIGQQVTVVTLGALAAVVVIVTMAVFFSLRLSRRITDPIGLLANKAQRLGDGDFSLEPVATETTELKMLDEGFNEMVARINTLMAKQIEDQEYLRRAELELLQAQINPHFLYNTLDSIAILAETGRNEDVVKMVTSLSVFFRNSLSKGREIISLRSERDQVASYLAIQQVRYSDILNYEIQIPEELLGFMAPKLILQPLVENALYHGTKNKRGPGNIVITGESRGDDILLRVSDDGAGMTLEQVRALQIGIYEDRHTGLGLVNVHKRIKLYCGEDYGLSFESEPGMGTTVSILLPKNLKPEQWGEG
ncbi:MAG: sensor histidine kinase [Oscillospiraceae bacterium]|jgi:two-component system sensor histidine kinase YesM|nr:sensor histidine kinase [Oscillospiraceae bacterium]